MFLGFCEEEIAILGSFEEKVTFHSYLDEKNTSSGCFGKGLAHKGSSVLRLPNFCHQQFGR